MEAIKANKTILYEKPGKRKCRLDDHLRKHIISQILNT